MRQKNNLDRHNLITAAILGAVIGIVAFSPIWMRNGGQYMEYGDYFLQYVPFIKEFKRMIASGNISWSWNSFLGDGFVGAYSYYTVFNPFAWIVAIFPDKYILYGTMFATILKLSISMVSSMLFMRCFCKLDTYALIGALLYTFSGFTLVNTNFYFFLDVIAVFPFVLYGLEKLIVSNKSRVYIGALMLNTAINYYFFVSTVIIVIIYVICRLQLYKISFWKKYWGIFCRIAIYSVIGTGLAGIALIPSFYAILGSGKAVESIGTGIGLFYWPQKILEHIRTLVAPIESGRYHAFFDSSTCSSTGVYLPIFGFICVLQWCVTKKDWLKKVCIVLIICYFVPVLNSAFNLFSSTAYTRWLYGMALIFSLVTVLSLEEMEELKKRINQKVLLGVSTFTACLLLVPTVIYYLYKNGISIINRLASVCETEYFMGYSVAIIMLVLTIVNYLGVWYIDITKRYSSKTIIIITSMACTLNFFVYNEINYDLHATDYSNVYYQKKALFEGLENESATYEYRIDYPKQIANYGLFKNMASVNYYNSLQNSGSSMFAQAVGISDNLVDTILVTPENGSEYIDTLLSVKYYYDYDGNSIIPNGFQYLRTENSVDIYENKNYIPMGFIYNTYCTEAQLSDKNPEERAQILLQLLVIKQKDEEIVDKYLKKCSNWNDEFDLSELALKRNEITCNRFMGTSSGFDAEINLLEKNIVFFSIPNDKGWKITVNGEKAHLVEVNYGLLGVCCEAGRNHIVATYHTQGWNYGIVCSFSCLVVWGMLEINNKRLKRGCFNDICYHPRL